MDDLRWVLALVGALVVGAIYLSSRFENEEWQREREQRKSRARPVVRTTKKEPHISKPTVATVASNATVGVSKATDTIPSQHEPISAAKTTTVEKGADKKREPQFSAEPLIEEEAALSSKPPASISQQAQQPPAQASAPEDDSSGVAAEAEQAVKQKIEREVEQVEEQEIEQEVEQQKEQEVEQEADQDEAEIDFIIDADADVEEEIVTVEIPHDLAAVEAQLQAGDEAETVVESEPQQASLPLGVEPLVLVLTVLAEENQMFSGTDIEDALLAEGLKYGDMRIFHYFKLDDSKPSPQDREAVFSVANLLEPGYFDLDTLAELETPGLSLFCQLPGPLPGNEALDCLLDKARGLAVRLNGRMCDDKRNVFTTQAKTHYLDRIAAFNRELVLAQKKQ
jgi:cell division protein ZipA